MKAIEIKHLQKQFSPDQWALKDVDLSVETGKVFGFLGPNGAGKTTTVKILSGILKATQGEVRVLGFDPAREPVKVHAVSGVLTEHAEMYDHLSAIDNLIFFGEVFGLSQAESRKRGEALLDTLDLTAAATQKLKTFSTGMRQRLSLARTLIHQPKVLFLDEPTSGLDPESGKSVNQLLNRLAKEEGITIFLCTHQLRYAQEICTDYGLLDQGKLLAAGTLAELRKKISTQTTVRIEAAKMPQIAGMTLLGFDSFEIPVTTREDVPRLVKQLVAGGALIYHVEIHEPSLEEIYFKFVDAQKEAPDE